MNLLEWRREGVDVSPFVGLLGFRGLQTGLHHHDPSCQETAGEALSYGTTAPDTVLCFRCWATTLPSEAAGVYVNITYVELARDEFEDATRAGLTSNGFGWLLEALTQLWDVDDAVRQWADQERTRMVGAFQAARAQQPGTWFAQLQVENLYESEPTSGEGLLYVPKEAAKILSDRLNVRPLERLAAWWEPGLGRHGYVFRGPHEVIWQTGSAVRSIQPDDQAPRVTWAALQPGDDDRILDTAVALVEGATSDDDLFVSAGPALHAARAV